MRSRAAVLLAVAAVLAAACGSSASSGANTSGQASSARASLPSVASPSPERSGMAASVFGSCRLPILVPYTAGEVPGGWLSLPTGTFSRDPTSAGVEPSNIIAWDQAISRWVPVQTSNVSPDGSAYLTDNGGDFRIIDARSGATLHETRSPDHIFPNKVIAYRSDAIYLTAQGMNPPPGVWKIDTSTGTLTQVSAAPGYWETADANYAWGNDGWATVRVVNLSTGVSRAVYKSSHRTVQVAGLTSAGALVFEADTSGPFATSVVALDGTAQPVKVPDALQGKYFNEYFQNGPEVLVSGHGFGLAAYDPAHGLQVLTTTPDNFEFKGPCVAV
jgi:hypothetical protein